MSSEWFAKIPKLMLKSEMPNGAIRLYGFIACHAIANNKPFLSYEYILENSTINDRNTVAQYIKGFDKRFIETKRRFNNSNVFLVKKPKKQDYEFVPMSFITDKRITDSAFLLYVAALFHWPDDTGIRHIKKKDLMKQAGIKSRTTLRKTLNLLQELEYSKISEEKQSLDITLYFKDGQIHKGNIPEKNRPFFHKNRSFFHILRPFFHVLRSFFPTLRRLLKKTY